MSEELLTQIAERLEALGEQVDEERIRGLVKSSLSELLEGDDEFVRKMRFGRAGGESKLAGSKFARWGLCAADVELLYDVVRANHARGLPGPSEELENAFRAISDAVYIPQEQIRAMDQRALDDVFPRVPVRAFPIVDRGLAAQGRWQETGAYQAAKRAMDTAESGYGSQLVGAEYVGDLWEAARPESRIFSLFDTFEMTAPTAYLPVEADLPEMLFVAENTSATASDYATTKTGSNRVQVDAKKFVIHQVWSGEMLEDSIIPYLPFLRRQGMLSLAHYSDSLVLNGDTTNAGTGNVNLDDADPADTKHYLAFDGLRHAFIVDNTGNGTDHSGAALSYVGMTALRALMVDSTYLMDWGHPTRPEDLAFIVDPFTADAIADLDETMTVDKYGPGAVVLTGEVTKIGRNPVISAMAAGKTEADGKISTTAGNNTLGQVTAVNRRGAKVGWRRRVKVETERLPGRDQTRLIYSLRLGLGRFSPTGAASGIESVAGLYNIAL